MRATCGLLSILIFLGVSFAQKPQWQILNSSNSGLPSDYLMCLKIDLDGVIWIGGDHSGLTRFDGSSWVTYDGSDGLPSGNSEVISIAVDDSNFLWIGGDHGGLAKFDGQQFFEFLPQRNARSVAIDPSGDIWTGSFSGIARFDRAKWTIYDTTDFGSELYSGLVFDSSGALWCQGRSFSSPSDALVSFDGVHWVSYDTLYPTPWWQALAVDSAQNIWFGTWAGDLVRYDGNSFATFHPPDTAGIFDYLSCIAIDRFGVKWLGFDGAFGRFDESWTIYTPANSPLPSFGWVVGIDIDSSGNKWLATKEGGLAVFNENGIVSSIQGSGHSRVPHNIRLFQNYPNPFNPSTTILYDLTKSGHVKIEIFNVLGESVALLVDSIGPAGRHAVEWNGIDRFGRAAASGLYLVRVESSNSSAQKKMLLIR